MIWSTASQMLLLALTCTHLTVSHASQPISSEDFEQVMKLDITRQSKQQLRKRKFNEKLLQSAIPVSAVPLFNGRQLENDDAYDGYGFDVANYSLKYEKCASISTYSDELAEDEESQTVLKVNSFVLLRLYPSDKCDDNFKWGFGQKYGEFLVDMETYLEVRQEYENEKREAYCEYCEQCVQGGGRRSRHLDEAGDDAAADDAVADDAVADDAVADDAVADDAVADDGAGDDAGGEAAGDDAAQQDDVNGDDNAEQGAQQDDAVNSSANNCYSCRNYQDKCDDDGDDKAFEYDYFFGCELFEGVDGTELYLGPHCSNGGKIVVGAYVDDMCSQYASKVNVRSFTGLKFSEDGLSDFTSSKCVSCKSSDLPYANVDDGEEDYEEQVLDFCANIYFDSAKCNKNLGSVYSGTNELKMEDSVCSFIENVAHNKYNEDGSIKLKSFHYADLLYVINAVKETASDTQMKILTAAASICGIFILYTFYLSRQIKRANNNGEIEWKESGIGGARSGDYDEDEDDSYYRNYTRNHQEN